MGEECGPGAAGGAKRLARPHHAQSQDAKRRQVPQHRRRFRMRNSQKLVIFEIFIYYCLRTLKGKYFSPKSIVT